MKQILAPQPRELLLPIISCLPTAFLSPKPPPALLPLLSPILRQRLTFLSASIPSPDPNSAPSERHQQQTWLKLLTWNPSRADRLVDIVGDMQLEPHPVSGELELFDDAADPDAGKVQFRRLDQETLHAKCDVPMHKLSVVWLWCVNDNGAVGMDALTATDDGEDAWRVAEVRPLGDGAEDPTEKEEWWYDNMGEAEEAFEREERASYEELDSMSNKSVTGVNGANGNSVSAGGAQVDDEDDDGSYWAAYDQTPGKTPTPNPKNLLGKTSMANQTSEADYFAQYGNVQPAMDNHDPDEVHPELINSISQQQSDPLSVPLQPNDSQELLSDHVQQIRRRIEAGNRMATPPAPVAPQPRYAFAHDDTVDREIHSPSPKRPSSSGSGGRSPVADHLEKVATKSESPQPSSQIDIGVKNHVGHEIKSLYRLAKGVGIDRGEFERLVRTELEMLYLQDDA